MTVSSTPLADANTQAAWTALKATMQRVAALADNLRARVAEEKAGAERARLLDLKLSARRDRRRSDKGE